MSVRVVLDWAFARRVFDSWINDYAPSMGAALAFYTMFSLAPLLLIAIAVAGLVFGQDAARGEIVTQLSAMLGQPGARAVQDMLASVQQPGQGIAATLLGVVLLGVGATSVFAELQAALDRIWRSPSTVRNSGWLTLLRTRLLSAGMVLAIGFLLMVSLVASAGLAAIAHWWQPMVHDWYLLAITTNALVDFLLAALLFGLIYKVMPRVRVKWYDVRIGAIFTALLFTIGKSLIALYIGRSGIGSAFGAAGSLVVILLWVYYSAQVFLLGAEFTWVYANTYGSLRPTQATAGSAPA